MGDVLSEKERNAFRSGAAGMSQRSGLGDQASAGERDSRGAPDTMKVDRDKGKLTKGKLRNVRATSEDVAIAPAIFDPLTPGEEAFEPSELDLFYDTDLEITVELGSAVRTVRQILELGPGSVIELNKLSGEPIDLFVNKRKFSRGEVVVIADNFGVRVTDIISVEERIEALSHS